MRRTLLGRKLLVASIGVASVTYAACSSTNGVVGNCCPAMSGDGAAPDAPDLSDVVVGNLGLPPPDSSTPDAPNDAADTGAKTDAAEDAAPTDVGDAGNDGGEDAPADAAEGG